MNSKQLLLLASLLTLCVVQGQDDTCKCSGVILLSKEELANEIRQQVDEALMNHPSVPTGESIATNEKVMTEIDQLYGKVERLIEPIATKLAMLEQPGNFPSHPAFACKEILMYDQEAPSHGYYWLRASNGSSVKMYCDMTRTCGGVTGGWMKVADLDMTNVAHQCPNPLTASVRQNKTICESGLDEGTGCASVNYQTNGIGYSEVCGKIIGYQKGSTDGARNGGSIDGSYIDGVSLTHGTPRKHIWSFLSAADEHPGNSPFGCYCTSTESRGPLPPSFVGQDYFCDTAVPHLYSSELWVQSFMDDPLWDGAGCGSTNECCTFHNPPWFYKKLPLGTNNNIEMRVCRDEPASNEDILVEKVDIYVR